jgi:excinuclease ABC subunit A
VIDLGPEAGDRGGLLVAMGRPEEIAEVAGSHTGTWLRTVLPGAGADSEMPQRVKAS